MKPKKSIRFQKFKYYYASDKYNMNLKVYFNCVKCILTCSSICCKSMYRKFLSQYDCIGLIENLLWYEWESHLTTPFSTEVFNVSELAQMSSTEDETAAKLMFFYSTHCMYVICLASGRYEYAPQQRRSHSHVQRDTLCAHSNLAQDKKWRSDLYGY